MRKSVTLVGAVLLAVAAATLGGVQAQASDHTSSSPIASSPVPSNRASEAIAAAKSHAGTTKFVRTAAARIWFRALTAYMTSSTNYKGARTATLTAAKDLYGQGSTQYNTVAAAWSAVTVS